MKHKQNIVKCWKCLKRKSPVETALVLEGSTNAAIPDYKGTEEVACPSNASGPLCLYSFLCFVYLFSFILIDISAAPMASIVKLKILKSNLKNWHKILRQETHV